MLLLGLGVALMLFSFTQRPKGVRIKWGHTWGFAEALTPRGRAMCLVGLLIVFISVEGLRGRL